MPEPSPRIALINESSSSGLSTVIIADSTSFPELGNRPGISDDGEVIAFYGEDSDGPGIFISYNDGSQRIKRVAGLSDGFSSFEINSRIVVNNFKTSNVEQEAITISYLASDLQGNKGLYTSRVNFFADGFFDSVGDVFDSDYTTVSNPSLVVEQGNNIPNLNGTVDDINIYDAINNKDKGELAFWVSMSSGEEAVIHAQQQQIIFLDFDPVRNFSLSAETQILFNDLDSSLTSGWFGDMANVFSRLAPDRTDLNASDIQNDIVETVQNYFTQAHLNIKVLGKVGDTIPTEGNFMHIFIGDGPGGVNTLDKGISRTLGIAPIDIFNQDRAFDRSTNRFVFAKEQLLIFVDNHFRQENGNFTNSNMEPVSLNQTSGDGKIEPEEVVRAIASTIAHEAGHALGLRHIQPDLDQFIMNATTDTNELRGVQEFSNTDQQLFVNEGFNNGDVQNSVERLAFAVGSELEPNLLPRHLPSEEVQNQESADTFIAFRISLGGNSINVSQAALGIVPFGLEESVPEFVDLGAGDLETLLNQDFNVRIGDQVFVLASTDGNGIDIFGVSQDVSGDLDEIDLSNILAISTSESIRGDLFDESEKPLSTSLDLFQITDDDPVQIGTLGVECFLTGTHILTDQGEIAVENLTIGDNVQTADGKLEPIKWIGKQTIKPNQIKNPLRGYPILIKAGALGNNLPHRDLYVSPDHSMFIDGLLINAGALVNDISILKTEPTETFTYYHIELENHSLVIAEGTAAESYLPQKENREEYDNFAEYEELYPYGSNLMLWPMDYPRISSRYSVPAYVSTKLLEIAHELFAPEMAVSA